MIGFLLFVAQIAAADLSFAQAKALADEYEAVIASKDKTALLAAQEKALDQAIAACGPIQGVPSPFTIVAHVTREGPPTAPGAAATLRWPNASNES